MDDQVSAAIILLSEAKSAIQADKLTEAATKLSQAYAFAKAANNSHLMTEIARQFRRIGQFVADLQRIELNPIETKGWILDIGGGGEGIIGQLNGRQVVAIDTSREALEETQNDALKVVDSLPRLARIACSLHVVATPAETERLSGKLIGFVRMQAGNGSILIERSGIHPGDQVLNVVSPSAKKQEAFV
jgi:hypothetical protein